MFHPCSDQRCEQQWRRFCAGGRRRDLHLQRGLQAGWSSADHLRSRGPVAASTPSVPPRSGQNSVAWWRGWVSVSAGELMRPTVVTFRPVKLTLFPCRWMWCPSNHQQVQRQPCRQIHHNGDFCFWGQSPLCLWRWIYSSRWQQVSQVRQRQVDAAAATMWT